MNRIAIALAVLVPVAIVAALFIFDPLAANRAYVIIANWWIPVTAFVVLAVLGLVVSARTDHVAPVALGSAAGLAVAIGFLVLRSWNASVTYAEIPETTEDKGSFSERVPFSVADRSADSATSGINGDRQDTRYLAEDNTYTTPVTGRGFITPGYTALIQQKFTLGGANGETVQCEFSDDAQRWVGGLWWHSLDRAIAAESRTSMFNAEDAWSYCDDEKPMVAVPLTKYQGVFNMHHAPAGVALYDGHSGEVEILEEVEEGDLPGPVISQSYAERVENSMKYRDNDGVFSVWFGQTGFETAGGEEDDPNADLPGGHQLAMSDGGQSHVTPLSRVSTSTAIERLLTIDSSSVTSGEHPEGFIRDVDPARDSNAVMAQNIKSQFDQVNWASGLSVQEIAPGPDGTWVASIGQRTNVAYRVTLDENDQWSITDLRGDGADDEEGSEEEPDSNLPPVSELSEEELQELGNMVLEELAGRTGGDE